MLKLADLRAAHTYEQLAAVLGISQNDLLPQLYKRSGYKVWLLAKKNGGVRLIASPKRFRRKIQRLLKELLDSVYVAPDSVHGFVTARSVVSNASVHLGQKTVINLDLKDCFSTVTFYRVRGLFLKQPFGFPWVTANILAHACTYDGRLPAGGIASPVILNFVLAKLDKRLSRLAKENGGRYSRYADDITFSFWKNPARLSEFVQIDDAGKYEIAQKLAAEIDAAGFESNAGKFRVSTGASRKVVTGLIVNEKINLSRPWLRGLESEIYAVEKFGLSAYANKEFANLPEQLRDLAALRQIHGKIAYARMVRGRFDWSVARLAFRFNQLHDKPMLRVPDVEHLSRRERISLGLWIVAAGSAKEDLYHAPHGNGTGFTTEQGLIVTAYHVIENEKTKKPYSRVTVRHQRAPSALLECDVIAQCRHRDIAVLRLKKPDHSQTRIRFELGLEPKTQDDLNSAGYPDYFPGNSNVDHPHRVSSVIAVSGVRKIRTNGDVLGGMSGGPLLDRYLKVVGVVHKGIAQGGKVNEFICVTHIRELIPETDPA